MTAFLSWYFIATVLGWLTFPPAFRIFPALADRGYALSRTVGLLVWGYLFWMFGSLGMAQNDLGGLLLALSVLIGLSIWVVITDHAALLSWFRSNLSLFLTTELLFFLAFAFLAFVRSANPELTTAEKPMELAFINSILRSPAFPPRDPWLSGYAISYYYFGYIMTAILAKISGVPGSMAHNLMTAMIFALAAIGSYGLLYNLLAAVKCSTADVERPVPARGSTLGLSLLAPLFLLIVSNLEGALEVFYRLGLFWPAGPQPARFNFWVWLDMRELTSAPPQPGAWMPDRYLWWWRASRVVQDYDLAGVFREVIDEFPFFSFLHADLHPHVLAIPFGLLAIAAGLNLYLGGWRGELNLKLLGARLHLSPLGFFFCALLLGGLAFLNTWDVLIAAALIVLAYVLTRAHQAGWHWERLEDSILLSLPLGLTAILLYLPFYIGFASQAGGLLPNLINPTRGAHLWVMFGPLFIPILAYLVYLARRAPGANTSPNWRLGFSLSLGLVLFLWIVSWLLGLLAQFKDPAFVQSFLTSQGTPDLRTFFVQATARRLSYIGSLLTLLAILIPALAFLLKNDPSPLSIVNRKSEIVNRSVPAGGNPSAQFVLLLIILGSLLVLAPEFIYLRDQFATRLNTVFKFYYQAWILWSLAAAFGTASLLKNLRGAWDWVFRIGLALLLIAALVYPSLSLFTKTNNFKPFFGFTLDDFERVQRENPDEAAAIQWLQRAPDGVLAEAVGGSYSGFARVATYSGLPSVLGWPFHESQWRGGSAEQGSRREDIETLYIAPTWPTAEQIIGKYQIRYIFIGNLERSELRVQEEKFRQHLQPVFQQGNVVIYEVP